MMDDLLHLAQQIKIARNELKNLRQDVLKTKKNNEKQVKYIENLLAVKTLGIDKLAVGPEENAKSFKMDRNIHQIGINPVGYVQSCFKNKNGTPHQSTVCPLSKAKIHIEKSVFTNPEHSLSGLNEFSHIWLIFAFHKNGQGKEPGNFTKSKVHPPRLNGNSVGVFASRSPHRPNPIGLTLTRLEKIEGSVLHVTGVDLIDGTPILDIKPYIPVYDCPDEIHCHFKEEVGVPISTNVLEKISHNHEKFSTAADVSKHVPSDHSSFSETADCEPKVTASIVDVSSSKNSYLPQYSDKVIHDCRKDYINVVNNPQEESLEENNDESFKNITQKDIYTNISKSDENFQDVININSSKHYCRKCTMSMTVLQTKNSVVTNQTIPDIASNHPLSQKKKKDELLRNHSVVNCNENCSCITKSITFQKHDLPVRLNKFISVASWLTNPPLPSLSVILSTRAEKEIGKFHNINSHNEPCKFCLNYLNGVDEAKQAIIDLFQADPRSAYRRQKCSDRLYFLTVDTMHITSWFDDCYSLVEVLRILPVA